MFADARAARVSIDTEVLALANGIVLIFVFQIVVGIRDHWDSIVETN